jgi:formate dehydrogenase subunit gamma
VTDQLEVSARAICERHGRKPDALIEILHELQGEVGYVPREAVAPIADALNLSRAEVHGVVTYYHDFRAEPAGRCVVKLCRAEACQALGVEALVADLEKRLKVKFGETRTDGAVTLETVYCLGNCALGPSALVNARIYGGLTAERLAQIAEKAIAETAP